MHHTSNDAKNQDNQGSCCNPSNPCSGKDSNTVATSSGAQRRSMVCIECKHEVEEEVQVDQAFECEICGISLLVVAMDDEKVELEVMDEGK